jgi:GT2 family glycosyltransferase
MTTKKELERVRSYRIVNKEIKPSVSIIMATHNNKGELLSTVSSIIENTFIPFELIVVAADCRDGTETAFLERFPNSSLIVTGDTGWGESNNIGALLSKADYLLFIGDDYTLRKGWLDSLLLHTKSVSFGLLGSMIDRPEEGVSLIGGFFNLKEVAPALAVPISYFPKKELIEVGYLGCPLISRTLFFEIGGFDPEYFYLYDDADLGCRLKKRGYRNYCVTTSRVSTTGSKAKNTPKMLYYSLRNRIRFTLIHIEYSKILLVLSFTLGIILLNCIHFTRRKRIDFLKAEFKAITWNIINLRRTIIMRIYNPRFQQF